MSVVVVATYNVSDPIVVNVLEGVWIPACTDATGSTTKVCDPSLWVGVAVVVVAMVAVVAVLLLAVAVLVAVVAVVRAGERGGDVDESLVGVVAVFVPVVVLLVVVLGCL